MPKPWICDDLTADMPLSQGAAAILRVKLPEVLQHQDGAAAGTVRGIHDMRVTAKRLREALRVLRPALPTGARQRLLPLVEALNDALGQVRDRDVLRKALQRIQREDPSLPDLEPIRDALARQRAVRHARLLKLFKELKRRRFAHVFRKLIAALEDQPARGQPPLAHFAAAAITSRLQAVMDHGQDIVDRYDSRRFHDQRLRVRKLKYAIEPFLPLLSADGAEIHALVGDLQELMGDVHDVDVQARLVGRRIAADALPDGARVLQYLARRRRALLRRTREHFRRMLAEKFAQRLQDAMPTARQSSPLRRLA